MDKNTNAESSDQIETIIDRLTLRMDADAYEAAERRMEREERREGSE